MNTPILNINSFQHTPTTIGDFLKRRTRQANRSKQRLAFDAAARALRDNPYIEGFMWRFDPYVTTGFNLYQLMRNALLETFSVERLSDLPEIACSYDSHESIVCMGRLNPQVPTPEMQPVVEETAFIVASAISLNDINGDFNLIIG